MFEEESVLLFNLAAFACNLLFLAPDKGTPNEQHQAT